MTMMETSLRIMEEGERAKLRRINGMLKGMPDDVVYLDDKDLATVKNVADWCRENL